MGFVKGTGRFWVVRWLYLVAFGHLVGGLAMTWLLDLPMFTDYHQQVLAAFGVAPDQTEVMALHSWWMSLFGATLQAFAVLLLALVYVADRYRCATVWLWLICGILVWAPQDIYFSVQRGVWLHLWMDLAAVGVIVPPLAFMWWQDRQRQQE
jgi:hypothetical protein